MAKALTDENGVVVGYIVVKCGSWHPDLRQPWGSPPACKLDMGHDGPHQSFHVDNDGRTDIVWR